MGKYFLGWAPEPSYPNSHRIVILYLSLPFGQVVSGAYSALGEIDKV